MASVNPIPDGYATITPYLRVRGGAAAIDFYKRAFGARELARLSAKDPAKVLHAELMIGDSHLMLGDESVEMKCPSPLTLGGTGSGIHLYVQDADATYAKAIEAGATSVMPPQNMFWGDRYAKVTDPFGQEWSIASRVEEVPPAEIEARAAKLFP